MFSIRRLIAIVAVFLLVYLVPFEHPRVSAAIIEAFALLREYAREHVLFCLIPAFFIAGAMANFLSQGAVIKYFGAAAPRWLSYSVASVSGVVLAVCSCTVLPLFAGIYRRGAGIGPAVAFLYSGPAINVLAIILTARVLGWQMGVARAIGAIIFAVVIGLAMSALCRREEAERSSTAPGFDDGEQPSRAPWQNLFFFATLVLILVFAAWGRPDAPVGLFNLIFSLKWHFVSILLVVLAVMVIRWFKRHERIAWLESTWEFSLQILPLLAAGVLVAGLLMGRPGTEAGLIPAGVISSAVGGNSLAANVVASVIGAFMYFATLTEIPILQGLLGQGMGPGPALALLLAGPALSLPNMLVIRSVIGTKNTALFVMLVIIMATISGLVFGWLVG